jgi:putative membrane protein
VIISWQGYENLGPARWAIVVSLVALVVVLGSLVSYLVTGYHVVGRELRVYEGLVFRRTRAIPVERLQSVELVQPLFPRIFGLAELRLEVVGGSRTEAPLAYLTLPEAQELRRRLLALAQARGAPGAMAAATPAGPAVSAPDQTGAPGPIGAAAPAETPVHRVRNADLFVSQLLRPQWWVLPIAIAVPVVDASLDGQLGFVGLASTITAVFGALLVPLRVLLGDWNFTLATATDGLRIRRGLLETRSSTVPAGRIQSVLLEWPLLWRPKGWVRANMHIAGVRQQEGQQQLRSSLLPVGLVPVAEAVLAQALPGVVLRDIAVRPVPDRAKWFAPLARRVLGYQLGPVAFVCRDGLLTRRLVIVPYVRIQSVRVRQGPLQRRLRLATVHVDVAGGGPPGIAPHLDVAEARALALALAERSRAARGTPPPS